MMEKTVLFAGKEYPAGSALASAAINHRRNVVITVPATMETLPESLAASEIAVAAWNKSSSVSARSVILQAENAFQRVDEAVLYFDTAWFSPRFQTVTPELCSRAVDEMISSYLYLSMELTTRFTKLKGGTIIFMLKAAPGLADAPSAATLRSDTGAVPAGILPAAAEAAFRVLAESTAAKYADKDGLRFLLVRTDYDTSDGQFAGWMFEYLDALLVSKVKQDTRHTVQWVKLGAKPSAGFNLFRK